MHTLKLFHVSIVTVSRCYQLYFVCIFFSSSTFFHANDFPSIGRRFVGAIGLCVCISSKIDHGAEQAHIQSSKQNEKKKTENILHTHIFTLSV